MSDETAEKILDGVEEQRERLTAEYLAELDALVSAATDGPYEVVDDEGRHVVRMGSAILNPGFYAPQHVLEWEHGLYPEDDDEGTERQWEEADATINLMARAPVAVPALLAEVLRLQAQREEMLALLSLASEEFENSAPRGDWSARYFLLTGEHMIQTVEGWEPGEMKRTYLADPDYGEEYILREVNAPTSPDQPPVPS